ncbi:hypothetical protein V6C27_02835 [Peptococcaceae bacterium 1198_IL3148]
MQKPHRQLRAVKSKPRKFNGKCERCGRPICSCKAYRYFDDTNAAISNSSPWLCADCYQEKYGVKIKSDVEVYKSNLVSKAISYTKMGYAFNGVDDVIKFIRAVK